jgi:hypothetical protein
LRAAKRRDSSSHRAPTGGWPTCRGCLSACSGTPQRQSRHDLGDDLEKETGEEVGRDREGDLKEDPSKKRRIEKRMHSQPAFWMHDSLKELLNGPSNDRQDQEKHRRRLPNPNAVPKASGQDR